jgi:hypothetical protein
LFGRRSLQPTAHTPRTRSSGCAAILMLEPLALAPAATAYALAKVALSLSCDEDDYRALTRP